MKMKDDLFGPPPQAAKPSANNGIDFEELNNDQYLAVTAPDGPALVLAGRDRKQSPDLSGSHLLERGVPLNPSASHLYKQSLQANAGTGGRINRCRHDSWEVHFIMSAARPCVYLGISLDCPEALLSLMTAIPILC